MTFIHETTISSAILAIKADAQVTIIGDDVDNIKWLDGNPTNITNEQILAKQTELQADYDAKQYKEHWVAYDLPIHLYHFTQKDINSLANKTGFKLIKTVPLIYDAFYISMLSEKKKGGNFLKALYLGLKSNLKAKQDNNYSSLIYILQKN